MFYPIKLFLKDKWIGIPLSATFMLLVFMVYYTFTRIQPVEDPIFLHYNIMFGVDLIGEWWKMWFIPAGGLAVIFLNFGIAYLLYSKNRFASRFLSLVTVGLSSMLVYSLILIVSINI